MRHHNMVTCGKLMVLSFTNLINHLETRDFNDKNSIVICPSCWDIEAGTFNTNSIVLTVTEKYLFLLWNYPG